MDCLFDSLRSTLDQLVGTDLDAVSDDGLRAALVALEAARAKLDAATAVVTGAFDGRRVWADDDAVNTATWLRVQARMPGSRACRQVRHARALRSLPHAREALGKGRINSEVVGKLTGALRRAIQVRDDECTHPVCDQRPSRCEVDHIQPAARGGATSIDNGRLLWRPPQPQPPPHPTTTRRPRMTGLRRWSASRGQRRACG